MLLVCHSFRLFFIILRGYMSSSDKKKDLGEDFLKKVEKQKKANKEFNESVKKNLEFLNTEKEEMQKMMQDLNSIVDQIEAIRKDIQERTGLNFEDMKAYVEDPKNFSEIEWKKLKKRKADIEQELQQMTQKSMNRSAIPGKASSSSKSKVAKSGNVKNTKSEEGKVTKKSPKSRRDKWLRLS